MPGEPGSVFEHPDPVPGHSDCEARRDDYISGACTGDDAGVERFPDDCESPAECPGAHSSPFDNSAPFNPRGCEASFNSSTARACFESSAQADRITASRMRSPTSNGAEAPPGFAAPPATKRRRHSRSTWARSRDCDFEIFRITSSSQNDRSGPPIDGSHHRRPGSTPPTVEPPTPDSYFLSRRG